MKKFIAMFLIGVLGFAYIAEAKGGGGRSGGSRSSSSARSSSSLNISKPSTTPLRSGSSTIKNTPTTSTTNNYRSSYGPSGFGSSLMGSVVGTVAGNMIYSSLSSGQRYGEYVNDGNAQYQQILSSTGAVVGYQVVPQEDKGLGWFWWLIIIGICTAIAISFFNRD